MRRAAKWTLGITGGLITVAIIGGGIIMAVFYRSDLTREQLSDEYITEFSQYMQLSTGASVHVRDEGNPHGTPIVMIHGGFGSLHNWEGWVEQLGSDYRMVSMDLLGHGLTGAYPAQDYTRYAQRDMVHEVLQDLEVDKYVLTGNSFGGGIALELALKHPDDISALILVASEGVPNGEEGYETSLFNDDKPVSPDDSNYTKLSWIEKTGSRFIGPLLIRSTLESMYSNDELITDETVDRFAKILRYEGNREAQILMFRQGMYLVSQNPKDDLRPRLSELSMPTLVMAGEGDTLVPMQVNEILASEITNATLVVVPNAGHMPMIEKPSETANAVRDFVEKKVD